MENKIIYLKSLIDFFILKTGLLFSSFVRNSKILLFINSGQLGDVIISSKILESEFFFDDYDYIYMLIQEEYLNLLEDYKGNIIIIGYNNFQFKYNYFYRIWLILKLRKLKISTVYNLTSARPTWNDSLALGIGAKRVFSFTNSWEKIRKVFPNQTDRLYSEILNFGTNEYHRIEKIISVFSKSNFAIEKTIIWKGDYEINKYDIIISPFSSSITKDWDIEKFHIIISWLSNKYKILLLGSHSQRQELLYLKSNRNISISAGTIELKKLFSYISNCRLFIGLDSGISHLAIKTNCKSIILLGGGTYNNYFPIPKDSETIYLTHKMSCFNCEWKCNQDKNYCLDKISVEIVTNKLKQILTNNEDS